MKNATTATLTNDRIFYLNHVIRRRLSNLIGMSELMLLNNLNEQDKNLIQIRLEKSLVEFYQLMSEFDHVLGDSNESEIQKSA